MPREVVTVLLFLSCSVQGLYIDKYYEQVRNFTSGVMTGFEGPSYSFPMDLCLNQTTTIALDDSLLSVVMYAALQNWTAFDYYLNLSKDNFLIAVDGCDYQELVASGVDWYTKLNIPEFIVKLWWNSILIGRNSYSFYGTCHTENLVSNATQHWTQAGYYLGVALQFVIDPVS